MRIDDWSIPQIWSHLTEGVLIGPYGPGPAPSYIRSSPRIPKPRKPKKQRPGYSTWELYAAEIQRRMHPPVPQELADDFRYARIQEIRHGHFDPLYWKTIPAESVEYLTTNPENVPDPCPMAYGYPLASNLPSLTTYGNGNVTTGPPYYHGHVTGTYFEDTILTWGRAHFKLPSVMRGEQYEPLIVKLSGTLNVDSDMRPSRSMYSFLAKVYLGAPFEQVLNPVEPPITKAISWYQLYKQVTKEAPFHHSFAITNRIAAVDTRAKVATPGSKSRATVTYSVRPMFGHGNNNNNDVTTSLTSDNCTLFMLNPKQGPVAPIAYRNNGDICTLDTATGLWTARINLFGIVQFSTNGTKVLCVGNAGHAYIVGEDWSEVQDITYDEIMNITALVVRTTQSGWSLYTTEPPTGPFYYEQTLTLAGSLSEPIPYDAEDLHSLYRAMAQHNTTDGHYFDMSARHTSTFINNDFTQAGFMNQAQVPRQWAISDDAIYIRTPAATIQKMKYPTTYPSGDQGQIGQWELVATYDPNHEPRLYPHASGVIAIAPNWLTQHYFEDMSVEELPITTESFSGPTASTGLNLNL